MRNPQQIVIKNSSRYTHNNNNGFFPAEMKWYAEKWESGKIIESGGNKLCWNWEHQMRTENTHRRPDLMLEDTTNKTILLVDMACPIESNKDTKCMNKITRY